MKRLALALATLLALVACGGGSKPADAPGTTTSSPPDGGSASSTQDAGTDPDSCKKAFVAKCLEGVPSANDYCGCEWDVARTVYGDSSCDPSKEDLQKIHVKISTACSQHFPPELIEKFFMAGCTQKHPDMQQYCACSWTELSRKMPAAELVVERAKQSEKYQSAVKASVNACQKLRPASR